MAKHDTMVLTLSSTKVTDYCALCDSDDNRPHTLQPRRKLLQSDRFITGSSEGPRRLH